MEDAEKEEEEAGKTWILNSLVDRSGGGLTVLVDSALD
jgi:hypothetical protein